ncbi:MAG: hypothetical protein AMS27_01440 [Bacteroides sp. SM23_62_1]|nr:MAG: hypothetical protein AMS27_01440 [Bacteroides sp. SM23_62_1]
MNKCRFIFVLIIIIAISLTIQAQRTELSPFNKIEVGSDIDVQLILDKTGGIEWSLKNIEADKIITQVENNTLKLRTKPGIYKDAEIKAMVYYTDLQSINSKSRATIWSEEELYVNKIRFIINNGGECRLIIHADTITASVTEGSIITLKGETKFLDVKVGTGATFSGYDLDTEEAVVLANSAGKAKIAVNKYLKATATSKGFIGYIGEPEKVDKEATLGGEILQTVNDEE